MQKVHLKRTKRLLAGHLWIFSNELYENPKKYIPGSIVEVFDMKGVFMGTGYINPNSLISIRILSKEKVTVDREFIRDRIRSALEMRKRLFETQDALRLIYSEGDYLPGLIADRYGGCVVLQFLTLGMETLKDTVVGLIDEILNPEVIIIRNDSRSRILEGLTLYKETVKGALHSLPVIREGGVLFEVDPYEGQKTGFFLDQKENRSAFRELVKKGRGLDLFCHTGAWSLQLASAGADVVGVDESERAIKQAERNAELNDLQDNARFIKGDVFSFLRKELEAGERRCDFIVLDPPAFVKSASKIREAVRAYRELNEICMRLIKPGGFLATSSCSYHLGREMFLDMLQESGKGAKRSLRLLALRSQDKDHPVLLSMPETEYLKCAFLLVD